MSETPTSPTSPKEQEDHAPDVVTAPEQGEPADVEAPAAVEADEASAAPEEPVEVPAAPEEPVEVPAAPEEPVEAPAAPEEPVEAAAAPEEPVEAPAPTADIVEAPVESAPAEPAPPTPGAAAEKPRTPKPTAGPRPPVRKVAPPKQVPMDPHDAAEAARWGRVDDDGTVWVRESSGERFVGQFPDVQADEALALYVRRFLDLVAQVKLFEARIPMISPKEIDQTLKSLREQLAEPQAVGDLEGLRQRLALAEERAIERRAELQAEREAAKEEAFAAREQIVEAAEAIAAQDPSATQWKSSSEELRRLLDEWKAAQHTGPRIDKPREDELWKRFSKARTTFDRHRRQYFAELDAAQDAARRAKEDIVARAEQLSTSTEWGRTSGLFRDLMTEWRAAGRARRADDDALWERFRAAQQRFFDNRDSQNRVLDAEYSQNLSVKLAILEEAEALLPVQDAKAARAALRTLQDRWDAAGRVPRTELARIEARMRAVEKAIKDVEDHEWRRSNPETRARVAGATSQLENAIAALEEELAAARASGDARAIRSAQEALEARRAWLDQIRRSAQ